MERNEIEYTIRPEIYVRLRQRRRSTMNTGMFRQRLPTGKSVPLRSDFSRVETSFGKRWVYDVLRRVLLFVYCLNGFPYVLRGMHEFVKLAELLFRHLTSKI